MTCQLFHLTGPSINEYQYFPLDLTTSSRKFTAQFSRAHVDEINGAVVEEQWYAILYLLRECLFSETKNETIVPGH